MNYAESRGSITLHGATVSKEFSGFSFTIHTSADELFSLTAKSAKEAEEWIDSIQSNINSTAKSPEVHQQQQQHQQHHKTIHNGFMEMKGKKFYFSISDGHLRWTEHESGKKISLSLFHSKLIFKLISSFCVRYKTKGNVEFVGMFSD